MDFWINRPVMVNSFRSVGVYVFLRPVHQTLEVINASLITLDIGLSFSMRLVIASVLWIDKPRLVSPNSFLLWHVFSCTSPFLARKHNLLLTAMQSMLHVKAKLSTVR
jgi:hypothetical protein